MGGLVDTKVNDYWYYVMCFFVMMGSIHENILELWILRTWPTCLIFQDSLIN